MVTDDHYVLFLKIKLTIKNNYEFEIDEMKYLKLKLMLI